MDSAVRNILEKASKIINMADNDYIEFANEYSDCMIAMGEREVDYALYAINLSDDYLLCIESSDYSIDNFEIKSKQVSKKLSDDEIYRLWYP